MALTNTVTEEKKMLRCIAILSFLDYLFWFSPKISSIIQNTHLYLFMIGSTALLFYEFPLLKVFRFFFFFLNEI